jgi:hypothetical protein
MASTYTQNTGIEKPGSGDQSGTWGVTANTNFDIIDNALHGQAQITIFGSQDLTTSDGSSSDGGAKVIVLTGTPGATFELRVTPTDQEKFYTIRNDTDSSCRVLYKGVTYSSSNGVEIASGSSSAVTGDGGGASGVFKSLTPSTDLINDLSPQLGANLDLNSFNITGTGNVNITGTITSSGALNTAAITSAAINTGGNTITSGNISCGSITTSSTITSGAISTGSSNITSTGTVSGANVTASSAVTGATVVATTSVNLGSWTIELNGSNLEFRYAGDIKLRLTAAGALDVEDDITAYSGI